MGTFLLVDGAQLAAGQGLAARLSGRPCEHVYADLGDSAGRMGPVLTVADQDLMDEASEWECAPPRRHAIASLDCDIGLAELARHLRSVRYVHLQERRRHFLRYADTRTMQHLIQVLTAEQLSGLFGPISTWQLRGRNDVTLVFEKPSAKASPQPLRLSPSQGQKLLDLSRPDQLLADVLEDDPTLATIGSDGQRHAWMAGAWRFLEDHRWRAHFTRLAVGHVVLRTSGAALNDAGFLRAVESAVDRGDAEMIYSWSPPQPELENIDG